VGKGEKGGKRDREKGKRDGKKGKRDRRDLVWEKGTGVILCVILCVV
jgi:hypothetical protein